MNLDYLIQLLTNKLSTLNLAKDQSFQVGDLDRINNIDAEIFDVESTLTKLKLMQTVEQTALATSNSFTDVIKNAVESTFVPTVINDATKCLLSYDIAPYATDPYHEAKIQSILENMGLMNSIDQIEFYIKKNTPDSPLTGLMVYNASLKYNVDTRLLLALMELDSRFGTQGIGARTYNPGNVGNTGTEERTYSSWEAGVEAVASWLNNHRISQSDQVNLAVDDTYKTSPAVTPVQTVEDISIHPDMASGVTSATTSVPVALGDNSTTTSSTTTQSVDNMSTSTQQ